MSRKPRLRSFLSTVVAGLLLTGAVAVSEAPAAAAPVPSCPDTAADARAAAVAAVKCHGAVEVAAARDEKSQVFANADGSFTARLAAVPQRVRTASGGWTRPDPALRRGSNGRIVPAAVSLPVSFSGGGSGPAVLAGNNDAQLGLTWPGGLPVPVVSGASATYRDVLPGVDLVLTAQVEGFAETLVVKTSAAAANPALAAVRFGATAKGLKLSQSTGGALSAVDAKGAVAFSSGAPAMWDARGGATIHAARSAPHRMPVELTGSDLVVHPDLTMLRAAATKFPVYVDPAFTRSAWTMINSTFPAQSYWSFDRSDCPAPYASIQCAKVGFTTEAQDMVYRSLFAFGIQSVRNTHILDAKLSMDTVYSYTDTDYATLVSVTGPISSSTTWSNNSGTWGKSVASAKSHAHDRVRRRTEWGLTAPVRTAAGGTSNTLTLGLRADDEDTKTHWKKLDAGTAVLTVQYNAYPNAPDKVTVDGQSCATGASRPYVRTLNPEVRERVSDPDGTVRLLKGTFYWWRQTGGARNNTDAVAQGSVVSGQPAIAKIPAGRLADGTTYVLQGIASDGLDSGQYSVKCEFTVDVTAPPPPVAVTSTDYPADGQAHGGVGTPGSFTITPPATVPADFAGYTYSTDPAAVPASATPVPATAAAPGGTFTITPAVDQAFNLRVWARDKAGNFSAPIVYAFTVRAGTGPDGRWTFDDQTGADWAQHGNTATVTAGAWTTGKGGFGGALNANGTSTAAVTAGPIVSIDPNTRAPITVHTNASFTVAATVKLTSTAGSGQRVILAQAGAHTAAYQLSYSVTDKKWRFAVAATDVNAPTTLAVLSNAAATLNAWTYLVATYNGSTHKLTLYVNGAAQTATATTTTFDATGPVSIGRGFAAGVAAGWFPGIIDDARVYGRNLVTTEREFTNALRPNPPAMTFGSGTSGYTGRTLPVTIGAGADPAVTKLQWRLDAAGTWNTVTLTTAGGSAAVNVPLTAEGTPLLLAQGLDAAGRISDIASKRLTVTLAPALSGTVIDAATGTARAGVTVTLDPGGLSQKSTAAGTYTFTGIAAGTYTVNATTDASGCAALTAETGTDVDTATTLDLLLAPQADPYGYSCSTSPDTPFIHVGNQLDFSHSTLAEANDIPFPIPYYGRTFQKAWVEEDGVAGFIDPIGHFPDVSSLPDRTTAPRAAVVPFGGDDSPTPSWEHDTSGVFTGTVGTGDDQRYVIEWRDVSFFDEDTTLSFEAVFSPSGDITFNYDGDLATDRDKGAGGVVGMTSLGAGYGLEYLFQNPALVSGTAVTFTHPEDPQPISAHTVTGTITAQGTPLPHAGVSLGQFFTTTDSDGRYTFTDVEDGTYGLEAESGCDIGSNPDIEVADDTTADLALSMRVDGYGYTCESTPMTWIPGDTEVPLVDGGTAQIQLPFAFPYYGESHTGGEIYWSGGFDMSDPDGYRFVGPDWFLGQSPQDDQFSVRTATVGDAGHRSFVIEWHNVAIDPDGQVRTSFETVLGEDGTITMSWQDPAALSALGYTAQLGINHDNDGIAYSEDGRILARSRSLVFRPPAA